MFTSFASESGAVMSWLPLLTVMPTAEAESSVTALAPAMVYLFALLKLIWPTVFAESTVTVRGALMAAPKLATLPAAFGFVAGDQLPSVDQFPSASTFQLVGATESLKLSK